jgi:septum formation protein
MLRVVLASASPRRRELLDLIRVKHEVVVTNVDETVFAGETPSVYADRVARAKAGAIAGDDEARVVIAADTIVVIDDAILGKPASVEEAFRMLRTLSGRTHAVYTAVAVRRGARIVSSVEQVAVTFRALGDEEIRAYIATGEPMDKAGSYGIQGYGATIVERIDGDYFAVMGLALVRMVRLLTELGVRYDFGPLHDG